MELQARDSAVMLSDRDHLSSQRDYTMQIRITVSILLLLILRPEITSAENWSRFRGENGTGVSLQTGISVTWDDDAIAWQVDLPGIGHSSPCIWEKALFVTSATDEGTRRLLLRLNADTGDEVWRRELALETNHLHRKNSWASGTPATDGLRVYVIFADTKTHAVAAWDFDGNELWKVDLGTFESQHGQGVSPVVVDGMVIVPNDQKGPSSIVALDAETGEVRWKSPRPSGSTSYVTPMVVDTDNGKALICASQASGVSSLDLATGHTHWETGPLPERTVASPVESHGIVLATCGKGGQGKYMVFVDLNARSEKDRIARDRRQRLPYVPTPVIWEGLAFLWGDSGVVSCVELPSGENVWTERVPGNYSASPVCINGHVYCVAEDGVVTVIEASRSFRLLGRTPLGDPCYSSPAVANRHLYLRTFHTLFAIQANAN